jgi:flagellar biosynthesis protein FlhA
VSEPTSLLRPIARTDVAMIGLVGAIIGAMLLPLPAIAIDTAIIANLVLSIGILIVGMNVRRPLEFSSFPSLLLIATLIRIAISIAATRKILIEAHAGSVIDAFGSVIVGGNPIVGIVVFLILIVVQYVVVTNGAGRVSEVAARFTLDAMPGKQMAIDADMNAGLIDADAARARRAAIEREANFYGAMDGASKFVKGDAIAGIVIVLVNIIGGLLIGVLTMGMEIGDAATTYTILTVGEGLVAQIGSLLVSVAMGILVTRNAEERTLGSAISTQIGAWARIFRIIGLGMAALGFVPGFPALVFWIAGGGIAAIATAVANGASSEPAEAEVGGGVRTATSSSDNTGEPAGGALLVEPAEIEVGYGIAAIVKGNSGTEITARLALVRRELATEIGFLFPMVRTQDVHAEANGYRIKLRGVAVAEGSLYPSRLMAMTADGGQPAIDGIPGNEPIYGLPAVWISPVDRARAEEMGYIVHEPLTILVHHIRETMRRHAHELFSRQDAKLLIETLREKYPAVVDDLVPNTISMGTWQAVIAGLLAEGVSIRDLVTIAESVSAAAVTSKEPLFLIEAARRALKRQISARLRAADGAIHAAAIEAGLDARLGADRLRVDGGGVTLALSPAELRAIVDGTTAGARALADAGYPPILIVTGKIRRALRGLLGRPLPELTVIAYEEIDPTVTVDIRETVRLG